ncbi:hypothetical protein CHF27_010850 [Romboutsia maritimum]|uniref:Lipoprotein n=1 Tax=Romboutsia maritimum TaxID=2020948 RepID=A0A371IR06_9FIRM|nr:hypothetical protein [Romboutsia maritimum]RDY22909.1 hypothetical protein CHF27_010850 [Romboutsia maritimum]
MKIPCKILLLVATTIFLCVGCSVNQKSIENDVPYIEKNGDKYADIDNDVVNERYKNVDKKTLTYETSDDKGTYMYESNEGLFSQNYLDKQKPINDKKYVSILNGYTYACEVNQCNVTYEEALNLVSKLLPDDIKMTGTRDYQVNRKYITYSSSKGNFMVDFVSQDEVNKGNVVGINYSKELTN